MNDRARRALDAIAARNKGRLTPNEVVAAAKSPRSPLHRHFTWDDRKAAASWRLDEARTLIASYEYVLTVSPFVVKAPMFVRDPTMAPLQGYISTARLRTDEQLAREVLLAEFDRALAALRRAKEVAHAIGMGREVEQLHFQVEQLSGRAQQVTA
ncbi:MAG TPA: hypothetical protein VL614_00645 [Acetobacteraceae bacterium]|jgi:hypothetical protein|nr:hypothetical protein [Acetobacteraceae bacterium]